MNHLYRDKSTGAERQGGDREDDGMLRTLYSEDSSRISRRGEAAKRNRGGGAGMTAVTIIKTGKAALVKRREEIETVVTLRGGQTRLFTNDEVTEPYECCPVCWGRLDVRGKCPDVDKHALAAYRFMASNNRINRAARRGWARKVKYMENKMRRSEI